MTPSTTMKSQPAVKIWSASPTPLNDDLTVDVAAVERTVRDAVAEGIQGLFLAGTCGEGPWLPDAEKRRLVKTAVAAAGGKLKIAVQVSDNSVPRILDNADKVAADGAHIAIIAAPATMLNATPARIAGLFTEAATKCPLPVGIYDLGRHRPIAIPEDRLRDIYLLPQVQVVKDSSGSPDRRAIALSARDAKPSLQLFNGDEFRCLDYLQAGYDGCMFGGAAAVAARIHRVVSLFQAGKIDEARVEDNEMKRVLFGIYGGEAIACWLTGLKYFMVRRGLFTTQASFLGYPLTAECRAFIDEQTASALSGAGSRVAT